MFSVIILDFDGFLNKKEKLTRMNFSISFMKAETNACGVVTCKRHEAHAGTK